MPQWTLDYLHIHAAILVTPNYRLMPEATSTDIAADISDFWTWLLHAFPAYLARVHPGTEADLDRICSTGASAGAYLAVQSAFTRNQAYGCVRAVIGAYPMLDVGSAFFSSALGQRPAGIPTLPTAVLDEHLASMVPGAVVSEVDPPERFQLAVAMVQQGRWAEFLGGDEELYPMRMVERVEECPFMFFFHGVDDTSVPVEGTMRFAEKVNGRFGEGKCYLYAGPGDHGFDTSFTLDDPWMKEGLGRVTEAWLGK
jgi:acetyl esterase/lipase